LLALEMKKASGRERDKLSDKERLRALTSSPYEQVWPYNGEGQPEHVYGYKIGIYMELDRLNRTCYFERFV
jgi:hypothetical protein